MVQREVWKNSLRWTVYIVNQGFSNILSNLVFPKMSFFMKPMIKRKKKYQHKILLALDIITKRIEKELCWGWGFSQLKLWTTLLFFHYLRFMISFFALTQLLDVLFFVKTDKHSMLQISFFLKSESECISYRSAFIDNICPVCIKSRTGYRNV